MAGTRQKALGCLIILAAAAGAYLPVFSNGFAWDDEYLVLKNPAITKIESIPGFFVDSWAGSVDYELGKAQNKPYFRPMALTSMTIDWAIDGPNPIVFHGTNLLLHGAAACFLFLWLMKLFSSRTAPRQFDEKTYNPLIPAFVAALIWAIHPVSTEAVNLVSYRTSILSGLSVFAALFLLEPAYREYGSLKVSCWWKTAVAAAFFAMGLLSKETTLVMPGLLFVTDVAARRFDFKRILSVYVPLGVVAAAWLVMRSQFTGAGVYTYFEGLTAAQSVLMAGRIFYLYVRLAMVPWPLCPFYDWGILGVPKSLLEPDIAAGFLLMAMIVAAIALNFRKRPLFASGLTIFMVALLPVSHIIPFFDAAGDRFMYVPLAGVVLAAAGAAVEFPVFLRLKRFGVVLVPAVTVAFAAMTFVRSGQWVSSESMLKVTTADFPTSISAHLGLGRLYLEKDSPAEAVAPLKQVVTLSPSLAIGHALLAIAQARSGDIAAARLTLRNSPMPQPGRPGTVELTRNELMKSRQSDLAKALGLMSP